MSNNSKLKALIFDVDGTLADTEEAHREAFNDAFIEFGYDWHWDTQLYKTLLRTTGGKERLMDFWETIGFHPHDPLDIKELAGKIHRRKTELFGERLIGGRVPLRPGVARLIREARDSGIALAIATTTSPSNVEALFRGTMGTDVLDWFAVIGAGDVVPAKKPAPDIYEYVLDRLGLAAEDCLALEDSSNGLKAALGAGLKTLITLSTYTVDEDFPGALAVLSHFGEPDKSFRAVEGLDAGGATFVDINLLQRWHMA